MRNIRSEIPATELLNWSLFTGKIDALELFWTFNIGQEKPEPRIQKKEYYTIHFKKIINLLSLVSVSLYWTLGRFCILSRYQSISWLTNLGLSFRFFDLHFIILLVGNLPMDDWIQVKNYHNSDFTRLEQNKPQSSRKSAFEQ